MPRATPQTLFVGRLSRETTEDKLRREFEQFGPIKVLRIVEDSEVCRASSPRAAPRKHAAAALHTHTHAHPKRTDRPKSARHDDIHSLWVQ